MNPQDRFLDVAVVDIEAAKVAAYDDGYRRFARADNPDGIDLEGYKSGSTWANVVSPGLRAMAGFADSGPGTYTRDRQVAVVPKSHMMDDQPIEAELTDATHVHGELVQAFDAGAYDGASGEERDHDAAITA